MKIITLILIFAVLTIPAAATWPNINNTERTPYTGSTTETRQIPFIISNTSGTNNATNFFCAGLCKTNYTDLIFYLNNNTILPYYIENNATGAGYVNITGTGTLSAYFGNTLAANLSNATTTLYKYDDHNDGIMNTSGLWTWQPGFGGCPGTDGTLGETGGAMYLGGCWDGGSRAERTLTLIPTIDLTKYKIEANLSGGHGSQYIQRYLVITGATGHTYTVPSGGTYYAYNITKVGSNLVIRENGAIVVDVADANSIFTYSWSVRGDGNTWIQQDFFRITNFNYPEPAGPWGTKQTLNYNNNRTNDKALNINAALGAIVTFTLTVTGMSVYSWYKNEVLQGDTSSSAAYLISAVTNITGYSAQGDSITWFITPNTYSLTLLSPTNSSTTTSPAALTWREWPTTNPYTWQVSDDNQFINIISSGTATSSTENYSANVDLSPGVYYWHVKNNTGSYSSYFILTISAPATTPGQFNITAFDEQTGTRVMTFSAQAYNSTYANNKTTTTGWVNYSSAEISSGEYLIRIVPTAAYAPRSYIATSPGNVSAYIPATTNTINTVAFYLLDYTTLYPYSTTKFTLTKNNTEMYSAYFDADAKTTIYLIQGDSYKITLTNGNNIQEWGNYIAVSSGNVEITVTNIGIPGLGKYNYNISTRPNVITLNWSGLTGTVNFTILKGTTKTAAHQLITAVSHGQSNYIITAQDIYYISMSAISNNILITRTFAYDTRPANSSRIIATPWGYGSFIMPQKYMNYGSILFIIVLSAIFGAAYAALGAIVLILTTLFFISNNWLAGPGITAGFIGGLAVLIIITYLKDKDGD